MKIASSGPSLLPAIALSGFCTALGITGIATRASHVPSAELPSIPVSDPTEPVRVSDVQTADQPAPPPAPSTQLLFQFTAGDGEFVRLTDLADADAIKHGKRKLYGEETVAVVKPENVPAEFRSWQNEALDVYQTNKGTCTAHVTGFAVVTRLSGDPGYAGLQAENWNVNTAAANGSAVLAARIEGCGSGLFARQSRLAPIIVATDLPIDPKVHELARAALIASQPASDVGTQFLEEHHEAPPTTDWYDQVDFVTRVVRHPTTGVTWVITHARGGRECGGLDANIVGIFKLRRDGTLVTVDIRKDSLYLIDNLIDLDNDGTLELIGKDWLGVEEILEHGDGKQIDSFGMPFHGCPC